MFIFSLLLGLAAYTLASICLARCAGFSGYFRNVTDSNVMLLMFLSMSACAAAIYLQVLYANHQLTLVAQSVSDAGIVTARLIGTVSDRLSLTEGAPYSLLVVTLILNVISISFYAAAKSQRRMSAETQKIDAQSEYAVETKETENGL